MSRCTGRCRCHASSWDVLDQAAGIASKVRRKPGMKPYEKDRNVFEEKLRVVYLEEQDAEPERKPSLVRVAKRLLMDRRTLKSTIDRLGASWPPDPDQCRAA